jgi:predicted dehydrogenase
MPCIEVYGTEGTLKVPDPSTFGGPVFVKRFREEEWSKIPLLKGYSENSRGLGITEMAIAIKEDRPHRASGELAFHVLDIMQSIHDASTKGRYIKLKSRCKRPEAL